MSGRHQEIAAVEAVLDGLVAAWGRNDADAYGALFTEDASYVTFLGTAYQGRRDIVEGHRALFASFLKGTKLADKILDIRFPTPEVAVVVGRGDTYKRKRPTRLSKVQTYTMVREADGRWRVSAFHNTQRKPVIEKISFLFSPGTLPQAQR